MQPHYTSEAAVRGILELVRRLSPGQIPEVETAVREARQRAETLVEIDEAGGDRTCPHCDDDRRAKWGRTRTGVQRWRCAGCCRTWSGLTGTPVAGIHQPALLLEAVKNIMGDTPLSCRKLAAFLGVSRHTAWRWRMKLLAALPSGPAEILQGIVEADETWQRESRKGSREWVRHAREPQIHSKPPRKRWRDYGRKGPPQAIAKAYQRPLLGVPTRGRSSVLWIGRAGRA
jgi:transposase-like protein